MNRYQLRRGIDLGNDLSDLVIKYIEYPKHFLFKKHEDKMFLYPARRGFEMNLTFRQEKGPGFYNYYEGGGYRTQYGDMATTFRLFQLADIHNTDDISLICYGYKN